MKKKSFMELYQEAKQKPTPAQSFIAESLMPPTLYFIS